MCPQEEWLKQKKEQPTADYEILREFAKGHADIQLEQVTWSE